MEALAIVNSIWDKRKEAEEKKQKEAENGDDKKKSGNVRIKKLIIPSVSYDGMNGSLNNSHWFFNIGYGFREALDIEYSQRMENKKPVFVWTQGGVIGFKEGDLISSRDGRSAVQVRFANPMGWDEKNESVYEGSVTYDEYSISAGKYTKESEKNCTQMQFLQLMIGGSY